ncbi:MAG: PQQ-binding-like beta-propeller repeat protein, partial [Planctomycetia bacterium]
LQVGNEYCQWQAIRLNLSHRGELPEDSIAWTGEDGLPDTVSPVVVNGLLLLTTSDGYVTCYDAASGKMLWEEEFEADFTASPGVMGGKVYYIAKEGNGWVIEPTREGCKRLNETNLGEPCVTSPAFQDGRIYLRGQDHVFGLGTKTP